jgi:hypothetical protein
MFTPLIFLDALRALKPGSAVASHPPPSFIDHPANSGVSVVSVDDGLGIADQAMDHPGRATIYTVHAVTSLISAAFAAE